MSKVTQRGFTSCKTSTRYAMTIRELMRAGKNKTMSAKILLEIEGRFYKAESIQALEGDALLIHAESHLDIVIVPERNQIEQGGSLAGAIEEK